jgi:hypothetical protein
MSNAETPSRYGDARMLVISKTKQSVQALSLHTCAAAAAVAAADAKLQCRPPGVRKGCEAVRGALQQRDHRPQTLQHGQTSGDLRSKTAVAAEVADVVIDCFIVAE